MTTAFDFQAPAELFPLKSRGFRTNAVSYKRFSSAALAVRYAIEELGPDMLSGAILEVEENRYDGDAIRELYSSESYPFERKHMVGDAPA